MIEVGVDVANATVMLIEHAERFGLAQLHQLRGRVGRGSQASLCVLMTPAKIGDTARERIEAMVSTTDGFRLAEVDLRLRGPGEMAGTRQSGLAGISCCEPDGGLRHAGACADVKRRSLSNPRNRCNGCLKELAARSSSITPAGLATVG